MPRTKLLKYESKAPKSPPKTETQVSKEKESPKLSAFAQEFHPSDALISEPLDYQDFPISSYDFASYDYNPYLEVSPEYPPEFDSDRKPLRECDKLEGLDFNTFVVFANVKNIPLEMNVSDPGDGPGRLRLCSYGYDCNRRTVDCPFTHINEEDGSWSMSDENWLSSSKEELEDKEFPPSELSSLSSATSLSPSPSPSLLPSPNHSTYIPYPSPPQYKKSFIPPSLSFISTTSLASTLSLSSESHDSSPTSFSDSPPDSPPDSPTTSSTPDSPSRLKKFMQGQPSNSHSNKKFRPVKGTSPATVPPTVATSGRSAWVPTKIGTVPPTTTTPKSSPTFTATKTRSSSISGPTNSSQRKKPNPPQTKTSPGGRKVKK